MAKQTAGIWNMKPTTVKALDRGSTSAIKGMWFLGLMTAIVLAVYVIQMVGISDKYAAGETKPIFPFINGGLDGIEWQYIKQTVASLGSTFILFGITLVARNKKIYAPFSIMGNVLILLNGLMTGLWFEAGTRTIMTFLYTYQAITWTKRAKTSGTDMGRANGKEWAISLTLLFGAIGLANIFSYVPLANGGTIANVLGSTAGLKMNADAIQGILNIVAIYLTTRRKTEGQMAYVVSNSFALLMFILDGQAVMAFSTAAFLLVSFFAWFQWESLYVEGKGETFLYLWGVEKQSMEEQLQTRSATEIKEDTQSVLVDGASKLQTRQKLTVPNRAQLRKLTVIELRNDAKELGASGYSNATKEELVDIVFKAYRS